jgi:hypothetical protein
MKSLFPILFLMVMLMSCNSNTTTSSADDREKLTHLKEVLWPRAYREQDATLLETILADEFQMIDDAGEWSNKKLELDYIRKNKPAYDSFRFEITRLDVFENGTAVVAGTGHIKGRDEKGPYYMQYQSSNILIKRQGSWRAISSHVSGVKFLEKG